MSLTDHLRKQSFHAEMDKFKSQEETAIDFVKMMSLALTNYDKVIIVLSENYKTRAEAFKGGVGTEYNLIIKDIPDNPNKYILVSFEGISDKIVPLSFKNREIIDLQKGENELKKLYAKLRGIKPLNFSEIGEALPEIEQNNIPEFTVLNANKGIVFEKVEEQFIGDAIQSGTFKRCQRKIRMMFINKSGKTIEGCQIVLDIDRTFLYEVLFDEGPKNELTTVIRDKIFSNQKFSTEPIHIDITDHSAMKAGASIIKGTVYSDIGETSFEVPLLDCVTITDHYTQRRIELNDFTSLH